MKPLPTLRFQSAADAAQFRPVEARIDLEVGKIDYMEIDTTRTAPGSLALTQERPISFAWGGNQAVTRTAFAYLAGSGDGTQRAGANTSNKVTLRCMGVGMRLRDKRHRSWENVTVPYILRKIADEHRLNLVTDRHTTKWTRWSQDGESDWQFVCRMAKTLGWWAYIDGTTLFVLDPDMIASRIPAASPLDVSKSASFHQSTDDVPLFGERRVAARTARFVDQQTGRSYTFTSDARRAVLGRAVSGSSLREEIALVTESYPEAKAMFDGIERNSAWYIERKVKVNGRADLRPLQPVFVQSPRVTQTGRKMPQEGWEQYDGYWLVKAVSSTLCFDRDKDFTSEVTLVRDARGSANPQQRRSGVITRFDTLPPTRLLQGRWVAAWKAR